jgi:hypothetical protein
MKMTIPHDRAHQFMNWTTRYSEAERWGRWFDKHGVPYSIGRNRRKEWTIYKHLLLSDSKGGSRFCCKAGEHLVERKKS